MRGGPDDGEGARQGRRGTRADDDRPPRVAAGPAQDRGGRGADGRLGATRPSGGGLPEGAQGRSAMKIVERVPYGERRDGTLFRYEGVATWYSSYYQHGVERRRSTKTADFKAARKVHRGYLNALAAERDGGKALPAPMAARTTVAELLDDLEADFRLRGVKWWAQAKYHAHVVRDALGTFKAAKPTPADVDRSIDARQHEAYSDASITRQTGLLRQALRLAHKRGTLPNVIEVRRLAENNTRQGFLERPDFEALVAALPDYLKDFTRFAYLTAWRR